MINKIAGWITSLFEKTGAQTALIVALTVIVIALAVGMVLLGNSLVRRGRKTGELEKAAEEAVKQKTELEKRNAQLQNRISSQPPAPREADAVEANDGSPTPPADAEAQNKELIFLTKEYLVNDFISIITERFPQNFELRNKQVRLELRDEKRLDGIILQLEKIESLASRYQYKFPLGYYYQKAWFNLGRQNYFGLLSTLREAIELFHREDDLFIGITRLLTMMARHHEAVKYCEQYLSFRPAHADTIRLLVNNLVGTGEFKKAEEQCRKLLELTSSASDRGLLGYIYHREGYLSRAEEIFEEMAKAGSAEEWSFYAALIEEERGLCLEALAKIQKIVNRQPANYEAAKAFIRLNNMFGHTNQNRKFMETLRFNSDIDPEIIVLYLQSNPADHEDLTIYLDLLKKICAQRKVDTRAWASLGLFLLRMERHEEAEQAFQSALSDDEQPVMAKLSLARLCLEKKSFEKARSLIDGVLASDPSAVEARVMLAEFYWVLGNPDEAASVVRSLSESEARNVHLFDRLGQLFLKQKNWKESLYYFNLMEELEVKNTVLFKNIAYSYFSLQDYENASKYYNRILELNPTNIDALNNLGVIYSIRKEYKRARKYFQRALQINPDSKETNFNLALLYKRINQESSVRHYAKYKELINQQVNNGPIP